MNTLRTIMLMTVLTMVLVFAGGALGGQGGAMIALILAGGDESGQLLVF